MYTVMITRNRFLTRGRCGILSTEKVKSTYKINSSTGIEQQEVTPHSAERHHQRIQLPAIYAPLIFTALFLTLLVYKCFVMILFQNKIIHMPSMPPLARREKSKDYDKECRPVVWREERIRSSDGVDAAIVVGSLPEARDDAQEAREEAGVKGGRDCVIV
jgi:hypothetical protein